MAPSRHLIPTLIAIMICIAQFAMLWNATDELSPNPDEFAHLVAGISYWRTGEANLYNVNPPLVRLVAGLTCVLAGVTHSGGKRRTGVLYDGHEIRILPRSPFLRPVNQKQGLTPIVTPPNCHPPLPRAFLGELI